MANIIKRNSNMPAFSGLFDNFFRTGLSRFFENDNWGMTSDVPVNIRENDKAYEMEVIAPGLKKEDFKVDISDRMLTISFEHKEENKEENKDRGYLRNEYRMQSFTRNFSIDETVDADNIAANYKDGILHVTIPKKEAAKKVSKSMILNNCR